MVRQSVLNKIVVCEKCHTAYMPESEVCKCPEPMINTSEDAKKQLDWYDSLIAYDQ